MKFNNCKKPVFYILIFYIIISCNKTSQDLKVTEPDISHEKIVTKKDSRVDSLAERIKNVITTEYLQSNDFKVISPDGRKFTFQEVDFNNDGEKEIFVNLFTPYFCGTGGCSLILLNPNLEIINRFTATETPIYIDSKFENGWNVLIVNSKGNWKALISENGKYPSNPSVVKNSASKPDSNTIAVFKNDDNSKIYNF